MLERHRVRQGTGRVGHTAQHGQAVCVINVFDVFAKAPTLKMYTTAREPHNCSGLEWLVYAV